MGIPGGSILNRFQKASKRLLNIFNDINWNQIISYINWSHIKPYCIKIIDNKKIILTCTSSFLVGTLLLAYFKSWIIFAYPSVRKTNPPKTQHISKKKITLTYWHNDEWHNEPTELIWKDDNTSNIFYLINNAAHKELYA